VHDVLVRRSDRLAADVAGRTTDGRGRGLCAGGGHRVCRRVRRLRPGRRALADAVAVRPWWWGRERARRQVRRCGRVPSRRRQRAGGHRRRAPVGRRPQRPQRLDRLGPHAQAVGRLLGAVPAPGRKRQRPGQVFTFQRASARRWGGGGRHLEGVPGAVRLGARGVPDRGPRRPQRPRLDARLLQRLLRRVPRVPGAGQPALRDVHCLSRLRNRLRHRRRGWVDGVDARRGVHAAGGTVGAWPAGAPHRVWRPAKRARQRRSVAHGHGHHLRPACIGAVRLHRGGVLLCRARLWWARLRE